MEIQVENALGKVEKYEVSKEYLELCFRQAKFIADDNIHNLSVEKVCEQVEECTSNEVQRSVITQMVSDLLMERATELILKKLLR